MGTQPPWETPPGDAPPVQESEGAAPPQEPQPTPWASTQPETPAAPATGLPPPYPGAEAAGTPPAQEPSGPPPGGYRPPPGTPPPASPVPPSGPPSGPARRGSSGTVTCLIVLIVLIALALGGFALVGAAFRTSGASQHTWPGATGSAVGVIEIAGVISGEDQVSPLFGATLSSDRIAAQLRLAAKDRSVKALVVRINSPGGSAAASQEIYQAVLEYKKETGKPVVASMSDVAASGGYYVAAAADKIMALPATLTGSIGVIFETIEYHGLLAKIGVKGNTMTSGPHKDMGSGFRPMTAEERQLFQDMIDDVYDQFVTAVAEGRKMDKAQVLKLADGRAYTGRQAQKVGLVDELGTFHDAVLRAGEMGGIKGEPTIKYFGRVTLLEALLGSVPGSRVPANFPPGLLFDKRLWPVGDLLMTEQAGPRLE